MNSYTNIDIESSGKSHGSGLITAIKIIMNSTPSEKEAIEEAKKIYSKLIDKE